MPELANLTDLMDVEPAGEEATTFAQEAPPTQGVALLNLSDLMEPGTDVTTGVTAGSSSENLPLPPLGEDLRSRVGQEALATFGNPTGIVGPSTWAPPLAGAIGTAVAGPLGGIIASGLATAGAEAYRQYGESQQEGGKPFDPFGKGAEDVAWQTGLDVGLGAIPYVGGGARGAVKLARRALAPFRDSVDEVHAAANALNKARNIPTSPAEYSGNRVLSALEKFTNRFPFLTGPAQKFITGKEKSLEEATEKVLKGIDPDYKETQEEVGRFVTTSAEWKLKNARKWSTHLFNAPTHIIPAEEKFATPDIMKRAQEIIAELARNKRIVGKMEGTTAGRARMPNQPLVMAEEIPDDVVAKTIANWNLDKPAASQMTYSELEAARKELGNLEFKFRGTPEGAYFARLSNALGEGYEEVGRVYPEVSKQIRTAKDYNRLEVQEAFNKNKAYEKISEGDASTVVERLFPPSISIEEVRRVYKTMYPAAQKKVRSALLYNLSGTRPGMVPKAFGLGEEMAKNIDQYDPKVLEEIFGKQDFKEIKEIVTAQANAAKSLEAGRGQDIATAGMAGRQLGDITKLGSLGAAAGGAAFGLGVDPATSTMLGATIAVMTPAAVAKFMNSKRGRAYLMEGKIPKDENFPGGLARVLREGGKIAVETVGGIPKSLLRRVMHDWAFSQEEQETEQAGSPAVVIPTPMQKAFGGSSSTPLGTNRPRAPGLNLRPDPQFR